MLFKNTDGAGGFRNVSLFTDASYHPHFRTVGGAWWAKFDGRKVQRQCRSRDVRDSVEAEIRVACKAIRVLVAHPVFLEWRAQSTLPVLLILVVDCLAIEDAFQGRSTKYSPLTQETAQILDREGITLKINHVKAHKGVASPRSWVNNWCDRMARAARKTLETATP